MATIQIVARALSSKTHPIGPCAGQPKRTRPPCWSSSLDSSELAARTNMNLSASRKQIAQGVLSEGSGAHERQIAGATPTEPSQTSLILRLESATFYVFYLLPDPFFGTKFGASIWPVLITGICSEMT